MDVRPNYLASSSIKLLGILPSDVGNNYTTVSSLQNAEILRVDILK